MPQPQPPIVRKPWPRQGLRHSDAHRLCPCAETAARPLRDRNAADDHPLHARRIDLCARTRAARRPLSRSEEHTSELQSLMRISYAVFCLQTKNTTRHTPTTNSNTTSTTHT